MSTKSTIAHGPNFHFYHEIFEDDCVYLQLDGTHFEAAPGCVTVAIPLAIWEFIRCFPALDLSFADTTDEELAQIVAAEVDARLEEYEKADARGKRIISGLGSMVFGTADKPRDEQIAARLAHCTKNRDCQRKVKAAIEELERANRRGEG